MPRMGGFVPSDHASRHEDGGRDEISLADLLPGEHASEHEDGGDDEISIASLSGTPAALTTHAGEAGVHHAKTVNASQLNAGTLPSARLAANQKIADLVFIIDGGGSEISLGEKGHLEVPFECTITQVTTKADVAESIVVDIWKATYANFPPDNDDSITSSTPPTLSSAQKAQDSTLSGWTVAIAAGDILAFYVDSVTSVTRVTISIRVTKS